MELMEPRRGHRLRRGLWGYLPCVVLPLSQWMGHGGHHPLSLRHALELCRVHHLPCPLSALSMERAVAEMGPCRHLLAHRGILFAHHAHRPSRARLVGVGTVHLRMALRHRGDDPLVPSPQRAQQHRDLGLCRHGAQCARRLQAIDRLRVSRCRDMDHRRGRGLHHRCPILYDAQTKIHAHGISLLRAPGQRMPYHCRVGYIDAVYLTHDRRGLRLFSIFPIVSSLILIEISNFA